MLRTVHFRELSWQGRKNLPCPSCGKKVRRQRTFTQTLNPFNKIGGRPKTSREIYAELREQAEAWEAVPVECTPCKDGGDQS